MSCRVQGSQVKSRSFNRSHEERGGEGGEDGQVQVCEIVRVSKRGKNKRAVGGACKEPIDDKFQVRQDLQQDEMGQPNMTAKRKNKKEGWTVKQWRGTVSDRHQTHWEVPDRRGFEE